METIIVTGGAGFIGANFVRYALAHSEARVVVIDKLTYAGNRCSLEDLAAVPRFVFIEADIANREAVETVFRNYNPDSVVNFAAETHVDRSIDDPTPFIDSNICGAFELLEASRKHVSRLDESARQTFRLVHVSTDEVYGTLGDDGLFSEATPYAPNSPYSASKAAADHLVRAYFETYRLPAIITNCSNNYGPFQFPEKLIPLTLLNAVDAKPLPIYGDGGNIRDWLYVEDHCSGIMLALKHGKPGEKYNIGGANERTNLQVVDRICETVNSII
ncbi:MAG: dTDP-glucose 4,6-dehydratase, partial [Blastocatellia bacterium]